MPPPSYALFTVSSQVGGSAVFTKQRFYYAQGTLPSPIPPGSAASALATWRTAFEPLLLACYAADSNIVQVKLELRSDTELQEAFEPVNDTGDVAGESLPPQDCAVITWDYATGGPPARITRGKSFFSGIPEGQADGGTLLDTYTDNLDALALMLQADVVVAGVTLKLSIFQPSLNTLTQVTDHSISPVIKTLRRRRPGS